MIKVSYKNSKFLDMIKETHYSFDDAAIRLVKDEFMINGLHWDETLETLFKCMRYGWCIEEQLTDLQKKKIIEEYEFYCKLEKTAMVENPDDIETINHYRSKASGIHAVAIALGVYI